MKLKKQNGRFVCIHTLLVLWSALEHPLYKELNWIDKNTIKWACLLHDIDKLSTPAIESKDFVHPFKSASCVLDIFQELKIINFPKGS